MSSPNFRGAPVPGVARDRAFLRSRQSSRAARDFMRETATTWAVQPARVDDMVLCASELATNAVRHGVPCGRLFLVRLMAFDDTVRIEVHDSGPNWSERPSATVTADATAGRGLFIVGALSDEWGVLPRNPGKIVWAEFRAHQQQRTPAILGSIPQTEQFNRS
ncbi:ATP-binding protein [Streptomyces sp. NPDC087297]|uniref:ATP-binding protein n=1 Tax=Streptomyces sp. NPDC087297 TaxID=3365778 RepID=UPI0037F313E2